MHTSAPEQGMHPKVVAPCNHFQCVYTEGPAFFTFSSQGGFLCCSLLTVFSYGARGDGQFDNTQSFQDALDYAYKQGGLQGKQTVLWNETVWPGYDRVLHESKTSKQMPRSQMSWKKPGKVGLEPYGTNSSSWLEALCFIDSAKSLSKCSLSWIHGLLKNRSAMPY